MSATQALATPVADVYNKPGSRCLLAVPDRGDCVSWHRKRDGLPQQGTPTDDYGLPDGWCWVCWQVYRREKAMDILFEFLRHHEKKDKGEPVAKEDPDPRVVIRAAFRTLSDAGISGLNIP